MKTEHVIANVMKKEIVNAIVNVNANQQLAVKIKKEVVHFERPLLINEENTFSYI